MKKLVKEYLESKYMLLTLLSENSKTRVELAKANVGGSLTVKKTIRTAGTLYPLLKQIKHRGIPEIFDVFETDGETVVFEKYISGISLEQLVAEKGRLTEQEALPCIIELCRILDFLHSNNIIHRDIKPSNIIISDDGVTKLIDFDCARSFKPCLDNDTVHLGTEGFAAPEQYGFAQTDKRSDIYALGVTLNIMLTGGFPKDRSHNGLLSPVINRCIMLAPESRYQSVNELLNDIYLHTQHVLSIHPAGNMRMSSNDNHASGVNEMHSSVRVGFKESWQKTVLMLAVSFLLISVTLTTSDGYINAGDSVLLGIIHQLCIVPLFAIIIDYMSLRTVSVFPGLYGRKKTNLFVLILLWIFLLMAVTNLIPLLMTEEGFKMYKSGVS